LHAGLTREIEAAHGQTIQVSQLAALMVALQLHPVDFEREFNLLALHTAIGAYDGLVRTQLRKLPGSAEIPMCMHGSRFGVLPSAA
jgi:hypothetical protein